MADARRMKVGLTTSARLGAALRLARHEREWNQADLSKSAGVARPQISAIELGRADCKASTLLKLLKALDFELVIQPVDRSGFRLDDHLDRFKRTPDGTP